jgi:hypothetical protein
MAITIDFNTRVINIPKSFLTQKSSILFELDVNALRLELKSIEGDLGIAFPDTHRHNTEIVLAGVTYARAVEIINGYTITFEDGQYVVSCVGANHNLSDVKNLNQVSLIVGNSAGLVVTSTGGGGGATALEIRDAVWGAPISAMTDATTIGGWISKKLLSMIKFISLK